MGKGLLVASLAAIVSVVGLASTPVSAADVNVAVGDSIQDAIDSAADGDTVIVAAGTYTEQLVINKPLTLRGSGEVIVETQGTPGKGVDVQNTSNVVIENITFEGGYTSGTLPNQTGIDVNSVNDITLRNVTVQNYRKNGISFLTQQDSSFVVGGNILLENVTVVNAGWAGIAFYTNSTAGVEAPLEGVQFAGTTTITNTTYGIQFGGHFEDTPTITGLDGGPVDMGVVVFAGNELDVSLTSGTSEVTLSSDSTVDGDPVTANNLKVTIASPDNLLASAEDIMALLSIVEPEVADEEAAPGVPNTATAGSSSNLLAFAGIGAVVALAAGAVTYRYNRS